MNRFSTSPFDGTRSPAPRPHRAPRAVVAVAIALALLVIAVLAVAYFLGWPRGDAPDMYSRMNVSEPSFVSANAAVAAGGGSSPNPLAELWPAR